MTEARDTHNTEAGRFAVRGENRLEKSEGGCRESAKFMNFDGFPDYFSFSGSRFADTSLGGTSEGPDRPLGNSPELQRKKQKMVCPDPGYCQIRDMDVQSDLVNFKGNFVPDERKFVRTQRSV